MLPSFYIEEAFHEMFFLIEHQVYTLVVWVDEKGDLHLVPRIKIPRIGVC